MTPTDIIRAFKQGEVVGFPDNSPDGNCVCIAWIKCAIAVYGLNNVFESTPVDNGYKIQLKDGSLPFTITNDQIQYANNSNGFILNTTTGDLALNNAIYNYACFCFAVMAKKADILEYGGNDFTKAVTFLNEGLSTFSGDIYLGLQNNSKSISKSDAFKNDANVGRSSSHAFFSSHQTRDYYGKVDSFTGLWAISWKFKTLR